MTTLTMPERMIVYPESDGKPMADNTLQFRYIVTIQGGLDALFAADPNVFVAGDLLWYPVEGQPKICTAPDALVAFGRPKGDRGSYRQWEEGGIAPQVVFEVLSPNNTVAEMTRKFRFYERHGVEEYYLYNPDTGELSGWTRSGFELQDITEMRGWVSPRLGVRFEIEETALLLFGPDGRRFRSYVELSEEAARAEAEAARAEAEAARAEAEAARAEAEAARANLLAERLRALGVDPDQMVP
jgi:Uma2 family endonuclease